jgi:hypothetical protein
MTDQDKFARISEILFPPQGLLNAQDTSADKALETAIEEITQGRADTFVILKLRQVHGQLVETRKVVEETIL